MIANALRAGIGVGLATLLSAASAQAQLSRTTTRTAPAPAPAPAPSPSVASTDLPAPLFLGPQLSVYGRRAVLYWRAGSDLVLSVAFGATQALGSQAVETTRTDLAPELRGSTPTLVLHQVALNGLDLNTAYWYRGTLTRNGVVVADTGILPFRTPLAFARVRPVEIEMHKDGDHDLEVSAFGEELYDNDNEGEVYLEWSVKVKPAPGEFAWSPKEKGCWPGGFSVPTSFPEHEPDVAYPEPPSIDPPDDWQAVGGCRAYSYSDPVDVNSAKLGSGDVLELDGDDYPALEWDLGAEISGEFEGGVLGQVNALPIDADGDGEPDWGPGGPPDGTPEEEQAEEPCGTGTAATHALLRFGTRGQEFDTATGIGSELSELANLTRIINHDVSDAELLCLDLRDEEKAYRIGVRAGSGSFEFTTWFEVTLDYRMPGEPPPP